MNDHSEEAEKILSDIERWETIVDNAKVTKAQEEGRLKEIHSSMKKKFGISTVAAAKKLIGSLQKEREEMWDDIVERRDRIKEKYHL